MSLLTSTNGLLQEFSRIVAEASMQLPALRQKGDSEFLKKETCKAIGMFFEKYCAEAGGSCRSKWLSAAQGNDMDALVDWIEAYADLERDPVAVARAERAIAASGEMIDACIAEDYETWTRNLTPSR